MYIHIPFCLSKCHYCAFYSFSPTEKQMDDYLESVIKYIKSYADKSMVFDTVYFGGGTPSIFGHERINKIISTCYDCFTIPDNAEITVECNPSSVTDELSYGLKKGGVNRISMGVQSAVGNERKALGRKADLQQVKNAIDSFKSHGIDNLSLDLMIGIPGQTEESLKESLDFIVSTGAKHISVYMLKIEEGTPLYNKMDSITFPDEDTTADFYLYTVDYLKKRGYNQYEVSNFSLPGYESRHNTKYWRCEEYLGIGPSAHSFFKGERFYYPSDFNSFINGCDPVPDGKGGNEEEYIMLALRLSEGLSDEKFFARFNKHLCEDIFEKATQFEKYGLLNIENKTIKLNAKGFLVSNYIIGELLT